MPIDLNSKLSEHFTLGELVATSQRGNFYNIPDATGVRKLAFLCENVLEPIRAACGGKPLIITSGYRCPQLNRKIGGSRSSQHVRCEAVDFWVSGIKKTKVLERIVDLGLTFNQLIDEKPNKERPGWIHIGVKMTLNKTSHEIEFSKANKYQKLRYRTIRGKRVYINW